jgi:hypothetical protein
MIGRECELSPVESTALKATALFDSGYNIGSLAIQVSNPSIIILAAYTFSAICISVAHTPADMTKDTAPTSPPPTMEAPPPYAPTEEERSASEGSSTILRPSESQRRRPGAHGVIGHRGGTGDACCSVDSGSGCMNIRSDDGW